MSHDLHVTSSQLGLLVTVFALVVVASAVPLTAATMRMPRRRLMAALLGTYVVSNGLMGIAPSYAAAAGARLIGGFGHAVFWSIVGAYASRMVAPGRVGRAVAIVFAGSAVGLILGVPLGTALGQAIGWRASFLVLGGFSLVLLLAALRVLPDLAGTRVGARIRVAGVVRLPGMTVIVLATAIIVLGHFTLYTYISPFLIHSGVHERAISQVLFGYGVAGVAGTWAGGLLVDRRPRAGLAGAVGVLALALLALALVGPHTVLAISIVFGWGVAFGAIPTFLQTATLRAGAAAPDTAAALAASAFNLGIGTGALLGSRSLAGLGIDSLPILAAVLALAGVVLVLRGGRFAFPALAQPSKS
jgi:predicted MFS family arabinose efflux permease